MRRSVLLELPELDGGVPPVRASRSLPSARRPPARPRSVSREPSGMPLTAASAGARHGRGECRPRVARRSRSASRAAARSRPAGSPSTVIPLTPSAFPHAASDPDDGHGARAAGERCVARERGGIEHGDQRLQVLSHDDVERNGERGLVALGLDERGAIPLGEQRQGKCKREEGDGDSGGTRARGRA